MAVSSVKHNKPVLPRTTDGSDLGSNRASIYSGKALDFDGVNDYVQGASDTKLPNSNYTICSWFYMDTLKTQGILAWGDDTTGERRGMLVWDDSPPGNYRLRSSTYGSNPYGATELKVNTWYFGVVTVDSSGNASIYLNGELDGTGTNTLNPFSNTDYIVGNTRSNEWMDGKISSPRVFDVVLTAAQVKELYDNPEQAVPTGVDATSLVLHLPMTEGAGSYVYNANANAIGTELISNAGFDETCQKWGTTDDATVEIAGGKAIWTNAPLSGSFVEQPLELEAGKFYRVSFDYTSTMFNIFVNLGDTQQAVPLGNGKFTYDMYYGTGNKSIKFKHGWTTNSSASVDNVSVKEVVPNYYNGTINGATWVSGLPEPLPQTALMDWNKGTNLVSYSEDQSQWSKANGSGGSLPVVFGGQPDPLGGAGAFRVKLVRTSASGSYSQIYNSGISVSGTYTASCWFRAVSGAPTIGWNYNHSTWETITLTSEWQRFTTTRTMVSAYDSSPNIIVYQSVGATSLEAEFEMFGYQIEAGSVVNPYIKTLGTAQTSPVLIKEGSTAGKDVFGNTITNLRASGAYNFDGDSWAEVQDNESLDITDAITLETWYYHDTSTTNEGLLGRWNATTTTYLLMKNDTNVRFYTKSTSAINVNASVSTAGWHHVVGTYDGTTMRIYLDGSESATIGQTGSINTSTFPLEIGRYYLSQTYAQTGQIANPRIYNYALTAQQVADNFNEKASTFGGTKVASELDAYIERTASDGATVEAHSCLVNYLTELDKK